MEHIDIKELSEDKRSELRNKILDWKESDDFMQEIIVVPPTFFGGEQDAVEQNRNNEIENLVKKIEKVNPDLISDAFKKETILIVNHFKNKMPNSRIEEIINIDDEINIRLSSESDKKKIFLRLRIYTDKEKGGVVFHIYGRKEYEEEIILKFADFPTKYFLAARENKFLELEILKLKKANRGLLGHFDSVSDMNKILLKENKEIFRQFAFWCGLSLSLITGLAIVQILKII